MNKKHPIETIRHSLSHILAAVVLQLFPDAKLGIGPAIENGFYYDFDLPRSLTDEDLKKIHKKMGDIIAGNYSFKKSSMPKQEAIKYLESAEQPYKAELAKEIADDEVSFYDIIDDKSGDSIFKDMCAGPHVGSTREIGEVGFGLDKVAGAYWRGSEKNKMLTRIYMTAFSTIKEQEDFVAMRIEAEKRDHRKLGRELELFFFDETAPGMPYWLPKGLSVYNTLLEFWRKEHKAAGYQEIKSPLLNKKSLYETSGHWAHYKENMFVSETEEKEVYGLKPMNCPNAMVVYQLRPRSYRELPLRYSDCDTLHRYEKSGTLNGLFRVREFSQDDAHIFITEEQIESEYQNIFKIVEKFYSVFGLEYSFRLSTRPDDFMGDIETWNKAEATLKKLLDDSGKKYFIEEGDGAFYGPKIDILIKDSLGREWQMGTMQLDFQLPRNFKLSYTDENGKDMTPVVIHRVVYGSLERFIGILTEHFAGAFPVWLAPIQAIILPIADRHFDHARAIKAELEEADIRVELDDRTESVGKKIRESEMQKVPYMLIVGDKEIEADKVAMRKYGEGDKGQIGIQELTKEIRRYGA